MHLIGFDALHPGAEVEVGVGFLIGSDLDAVALQIRQDMFERVLSFRCRPRILP